MTARSIVYDAILNAGAGDPKSATKALIYTRHFLCGSESEQQHNKERYKQEMSALGANWVNVAKFLPQVDNAKDTITNFHKMKDLVHPVKAANESEKESQDRKHIPQIMALFKEKIGRANSKEQLDTIIEELKKSPAYQVLQKEQGKPVELRQMVERKEAELQDTARPQSP